MLIAIDANPLVNTHFRRGIGKTTWRLLEEFGRRPSARAGGDDPEDLDLAYYLPQCAWRHPGGWLGLSPRYLSPGENLLDAARADGAALVHVMDYFFPLYDPRRLPRPGGRPYRLVVTVRDIIPRHFPTKKRRGLERLQANLFPLLPLVDHTIAISHQTKRDLVENLGVPPDKVTVVYHGVDLEVFHDRYGDEEIRETLRRHGLGDGYVLYVSAFDSRKNHRLLLDAFYYLDRLVPGRRDLVLVGPGTVPRELAAQVEKLGLGDRVRILQDLPQTDLAHLYRGASLFAFPSLYEGFGNPILEAMACGVPVVALRRSSVPEVAGEAAFLVDKNEYGSFARAMARVLGDPDLARQLREKGLAQAAGYTWAKTAEHTLAVYRRVLAPG